MSQGKASVIWPESQPCVGLGGDFEVNNPSAIEAEHNQGIKELERRGGDYKHVNRRKVGQVVA